MTPLLQVRGLSVDFAGDVQALRGLSFELDRGESLAVVGESGAGKSTLAMCLAGLIQPPSVQGSVLLEGQELIGADEALLRRLRWASVAVGLQGAPLNPVATVRSQIAEVFTHHRGVRPAESRREADLAGAALGLEPELLERFPHQISGGQRRQAMLAMVLALDPALVVLDEPTSGLDPRTKRDVIARLQTLARGRGFGLIVLTHDLADAVQLGQRTIVLYAGEAMECGSSTAVLTAATHPYTWALTNAFPVMTTTKDLRPIRGMAPDPRHVPPGCPFHPRCTQAEDICRQKRVSLTLSRERLVACHLGGLKTVLAATGIGKTFTAGGTKIRAVEDVSLKVRHGESVGVIGPSGSGKTTLARILAGHLAPDTGSVRLGEVMLSTSWRREGRALRRRVQLVMQNPWEALSPRLRVSDLVAEPFVAWGERDDIDARVTDMLAAVGLPSSGSFLEARTPELSGGQLQRIALARALVLRPEVLVADEPTAMLDASEQARLLVLLRQLQVERGLALVFVSHDLAVVRKVTDRIIVLDSGRIVEEGLSHVVSAQPKSPVTKALIDAAPAFDLDDRDGV